MSLKMIQYILRSVYFIFCSFSLADPIDELVIITETYPPFNYEQNGKLKGISVDIMGLM